MRAYTTRYIGELPQQVGVNLATLERLNTQLRHERRAAAPMIEQREKLLEGLRRDRRPSPRDRRTADADTLSADRLERLKQIEELKQNLAQTGNASSRRGIRTSCD